LLNSLFNFLKGYVIIKVYGCGAERLINICTHRGIGVRSVERCEDGTVLIRIRSKDFKYLRPIAHKTHTKIHIVKKRGFFDLKRHYGGRWLFMAGAVMAAAFFITASQFIWTVEITGIEECDPAAVESTLRNIGIYRGALKKDIPDGFEVKKLIMNDHPEIAWAWAYISGTSANVRIYEKTIPPQTVDRQEPCDIVAACDGYIEKVDVLNGEGMYEAGDVVRAGEVIISGKVPVFREGYPEKYMYVHAMGEIQAYTQRSKSSIYSLQREIRTPTGKEKRRYYIDLFGKRINFYKDENPDFEQYNTSEKSKDFFGISFGRIIFEEVEISYEPMSIDSVMEIAEDELEEKIAKELCSNASLQGRELQYEKISENEIKVKLTMSFTEDIGTEVPLERNEEQVDKQED
jgi:similar to stage IV sporulation protein